MRLSRAFGRPQCYSFRWWRCRRSPTRSCPEPTGGSCSAAAAGHRTTRPRSSTCASPSAASAPAGQADPGGHRAGQHRHPTWSPNRTMIAYAQGDNATANYDIFLLDLTDPGATPREHRQLQCGHRRSSRVVARRRPDRVREREHGREQPDQHQDLRRRDRQHDQSHIGQRRHLRAQARLDARLADPLLRDRRSERRQQHDGHRPAAGGRRTRSRTSSPTRPRASSSPRSRRTEPRMCFTRTTGAGFQRDRARPGRAGERGRADGAARKRRCLPATTAPGPPTARRSPTSRARSPAGTW